MKSFEDELRTKISEISDMIDKLLPDESGLDRTVKEAVNYSVRAGGKRLRPILMTETYRFFAPTHDALPMEVLYHFAAAMEFIHTYSLVHDDLPAMDNDMLRRGKPTTHAEFGEAMAILAGDALLNYAYETVAKGIALAEKTCDLKSVSLAVDAFVLISEKAGICGMVGGQSVDVESEKTGSLITREKLNYIYENKTGALIEASMGVGAILSGVDRSRSEYSSIMKTARDIGLAFQIKDDILDEIGDETTLGKPIGSDRRNEKATYVTYEGIENSKREVESLMQTAADELNGIDGEANSKEFLLNFFEYLVSRDY